MTDNYKIPGVYVTESNGLSLSIQTGQTAVPVFAFDFKKTTEWNPAIIRQDDVASFSSWLEVSAALLSESPSNDDGGLYQSLKLFFLNGGGHCYVAPVSKLDALVPTLDDVTLLVQAGVSLETFNSKVSTLCVAGKTLFAVFDGPQRELTSASDVIAEAAHYPTTPYAAVYFPWLKVTGVTTLVPPSGAVAGIYARVDRQRGCGRPRQTSNLSVQRRVSRSRMRSMAPVTLPFQGEVHQCYPGISRYRAADLGRPHARFR